MKIQLRTKQRRNAGKVALMTLLLGLVAGCSKNDKAPGLPDEDTPAKIRPITDNSSAYVSKVFEFKPAPGQFVNTDFADINTVSKITENKAISLGAWGGMIVLGFDHTVLNQEGKDLLILGQGGKDAAEPGVVWVSFDANGNGEPDDTWYELKGAAYGMEGYERNYSVTYYNPGPDNTTDDIKWVDSHNNTGYILRNSFHNQPYFPKWITDESYTLTGTLLPDTQIDMSNATFIKSGPFAYGYADNNPSGADGGDALDISDAIDSEGQAVSLEGIDFIKIQTGILKDMGWLGEQSTELSTVADLSMLPKDQ